MEESENSITQKHLTKNNLPEKSENYFNNISNDHNKENGTNTPNFNGCTIQKPKPFYLSEKKTKY